MSDTAGPTRGGQLLARVPAVVRLIELAAAAGVSLDEVYLVGGAVRDAVLDRPLGPDVDFAVAGRPAGALAEELAAALDGEVVATHAFGTATLLAPIGAGGALLRVDLATCRTEEYSQPGALPSVDLRAATTIDADLARRDVTANAVAVGLAADADGEHRVVDPFDGLADIDARRLRVLHDRSFLDDPTRIFRVARYAGRLGFRVDDATRDLAREAVAAGALGTMSADRVRAELELVLGEPAWHALTFLASWGVTEQLEPRLEAAFRPPLILAAIDSACGADAVMNDRAWPLRLAVLARAIGEDAAGWLRWLGFPGEVIGPVLDHARVLAAVLDDADELRDAPASDLYLRLGEVDDDSFALAALAVGDGDPQLFNQLAEYRETIRTTALHVRGDDVLAAGVPAGPRVGRILGTLFLRALDGEFPDEAAERAALEQLVAEG